MAFQVRDRNRDGRYALVVRGLHPGQGQIQAFLEPGRGPRFGERPLLRQANVVLGQKFDDLPRVAALLARGVLGGIAGGA